MGYGNITGGDCSIRLRRGGAGVAYGQRPKSLENNIKHHIFRAILVALLPINAFAAADRFPAVQDELNGLVNTAVTVVSPSAAAGSPGLDAAAVGFESATPAPATNQGERVVPEGADSLGARPGGVSQKGYQNQELASLNIADTGVIERIQGSMPAVAVARNGASLEVVDTGTSKQVENPLSSTIAQRSTASLEVTDTGTSKQVLDTQPAAIVARDSTSLEVVDTGVSRLIESPQAGTEVPAADVEVPVAAEAGTNSAAEWADVQSPAASDVATESAGLVLAGTSILAKNEMTGTTAVAWKGNDQPEDGLGSPAGSENIELPYAVLLAILALMSMIPISRRNG